MLPAGAMVAARYRVEALLGTGGSGHAFRVRDLATGEDVALKLLHHGQSAQSFRAEFARLSELSHPHLMRVRDYGRAAIDGALVPFFTADLVEGTTLGAHCAQHGFSAGEQALRDALSALAFLHRLELRHGDVKPDNVLVDAQGRGTLIDLGFCTISGREPLAGGTPRYLAPELLRGEPGDARADLFALGVSLRELGATGRFEALAQRCLTPDVRERPASLASVSRELGLDLALAGPQLGKLAPLLGRGEQLELANAALTRVARAQPGARVIWVEGARGVGSTRFLRELCFVADTRFRLYEHHAGRESVRALLRRAATALADGVEGLVQSVAKLAGADPTLLVVHDLDRATPEHAQELLLAITTSAREGNFAWLIAATRAPPSGLNAVHVRLAALAPAELARWAGEQVPADKLAALHAYTGGFPLYVQRALSALANGQLLSDALATQSPEAAQLTSLSALVADLEGPERTLLACLALGLRAPGAASDRLLERGLVRIDRGQPVLARSADESALLRVLPAKLVRPLCLRAADEAARDVSPTALARRIALLAQGGRPDEALRLLRDAHALSSVPPGLAASAGLLTSDMSAEDLILHAGLLRRSGQAGAGLSSLARARRKAGRDDALYLEAAECALAQGRVARAARLLARARDQAAPRAMECALRIQIRLGDYDGARELGRASLLSELSPLLAARSAESLALACSYLGRHEEAERALDQAAQAEPEPGPRDLARRLSLRGFVALRRGDPERALAPYERALALADAHGVSDLVANALANLASARHMLGSYGAARDLYERASLLARALGRRHSELSARANLANLALECGALAEAEGRLDGLARALEAGQPAPIALAVTRYRAELCLLRGQPEAALALLGGEQAADEREQREFLLLRAEAELALRRSAEATAALAHPLLETRIEPDLDARRGLLIARLSHASGRPSQALAALERALGFARQTGLSPLVARVEAEFAQFYADNGSPTLEREHARNARAAWERMALDLKSSERDAFMRHPDRARLYERAPPAARGKSSLSFARVIELSRRINAQRTIDDVLEFALDAAIELASAERGFVLLYTNETRGFEVKCARALDKHPLEGEAFAFSRGIAEQVIQSGQAIITLDAAQDARFSGQASVHAMGLKSVLCVPVLGARGLRGALYLDNRFLRSRFSEADAELVQAFSEQVAVALGNAQLFLELEQKQRELLRKQRKVEELLQGKERELEQLGVELAAARAGGAEHRYREIVGTSVALRRVFSTLDRVIPTDLPVMVLGESGTGKELIARALHREGPRAKRPFVGINCGALPEALLESELFGHVKGAFTGAERDKPGLFVAAHGGTLFLDELGELSLALQVKLLRVLTEREVRPLGGTRSVAVDVRIVAATNRDLKRMVESKSFREDLYYRLNVVEITLPPLRDRREDILPIAEHVLARRAAANEQKPKRLASGAAQRLLAHPFPGNVRELENVLARAEALCEGDTIRAADLGLTRDAAPSAKQQARSRAEFAHQEAQLLLETLERERWNVSNVSRSLGIPRNTLYRKLARLGLVPAHGRAR